MSEIAIVEAFSGMPERRRKQRTRHSIELCVALFALAVTAGNRGFLAIGDWLKLYNEEFKELFEVKRIPSYSTIRRALLDLDYGDYLARLASFFE
ncbi:MAG: transposase family protein [Cyanobacteria bacterium J06621_8]